MKIKEIFSGIEKIDIIVMIVSVFLFSITYILNPGSSPLVFISSLTGVIAVIYISNAKILGFVISTFSYVFYFTYSFQMALYGEFIMALVISMTNLVVLYKWIRVKTPKIGDEDVYLSKVKIKEVFAGLIVLIVISIMYSIILNMINTELAFFNAFNTLLIVGSRFFAYHRSLSYFVFYILYHVNFMVMWVILSIGDYGNLIFVFYGLILTLYQLNKLFVSNKPKVKEELLPEMKLAKIKPNGAD